MTWGYPGFLTRRKPSLAALARAGCISTGCCTETYLTVDEYGCRAGASTSVSAILGVGPDGEPKTVYLDRPFVYMIVDAKYRVPLFIGTMMDPTVTPDTD